jgi:D-serine deaminase-like pyridoxal phosphate-dependent protein
MALSYDQLRQCLDGRRLPVAFVDLDALDRNLERVIAQVSPRATPLRVASKSVRVVEILRRLLDRGQGALRGLMCFAVEEAAYLADEGFDDLLVAYPPFSRGDIETATRLTEEGTLISVICDSREGIDRMGQIATERGVDLKVVLCLDMSLRLAGGRIHLGVRRSPLRSPEQIVALARYAADRAGVQFHGLMGYEAQVAGVGDDNPFDPLLNPVKTLIKRLSVGELGRRRRQVVEALRHAGLAPALVNGGGSGSLDTTTPDTGVTEVTAGSAFFKPHLFDYYKNHHLREIEPACFFALEVTRKPAPGFVTCLGGGYIASGPPGQDKVPLPWLPRGLQLLSDEGCGEVQTPLREAPEGLDPPVELALGDPIVFRHAKGGELAERFAEVLLIQGGEVIGAAKTYRGAGRCFF